MYLCKKPGVKVKSYNNRSQHRHKLASLSMSVFFTTAALLYLSRFFRCLRQDVACTAKVIIGG